MRNNHVDNRNKQRKETENAHKKAAEEIERHARAEGEFSLTLVATEVFSGEKFFPKLS
jgi:hypothetical protein